MKIKTLIAVAVIFGAFTLTSCKKERTCKCTTTMEGMDPINTSVTTGKVSKKDGEAACAALESSAGGASTTCTMED